MNKLYVALIVAALSTTVMASKPEEKKATPATPAAPAAGTAATPATPPVQHEHFLQRAKVAGC